MKKYQRDAFRVVVEVQSISGKTQYFTMVRRFKTRGGAMKFFKVAMEIPKNPLDAAQRMV